VAVKVLRPELTESLGRERFLREIRMAAKLSHPHILALYDSGAADGALYYVMPYVDGQSLRDRLGAGLLPVADAVRIAEDVLSALAHAHARGVVHRDIKPENILLAGGTHALVADFGIGSAVSDAGGETLTQVGVSVGTPAYMSPEQAVGEAVDGRSDLYSLGCVLYEMLVGEPPFTGPNVQAVIAKRFVQFPADVMALRDGVPRPVARAVQKVLARTPIDRFHTAAETIAALREVDAPAPVRATAPPQSIAVLPFDNLSADKENEYFGDGIAEEIISALAGIDGLQVAARTSAFSFKGRHDDLRVIGEKLNVATVLEGSVRKAGNRLRITVQLIAVADGYHLWSERYDRELVDVFAVQDEIASAIAAKLQVTFDRPAKAERGPATPKQVEAYEAYIKGRVAMSRRVMMPEAARSFERVIALEPHNAKAHASLAETFRLLANFGIVSPTEAIPRAKASIARALELDPRLAEAMSTAAVVAIAFDNDPERAITLWERTLELDPKLAEARVMYAQYGLLFHRNDERRAVAEARRAVDDDPRSGIVLALAAQTLGMAGRLHDARRLALEAAEIDDQSTLTNATATLVLAEAGEGDDALRFAQRTLSLSGRATLGLAVCAVAESVCGNPHRADAYHRELCVRAELDAVMFASLTMTATAAGRADEAMEYALRSVDAHELLSGSLLRWKSFAPLRAHPRFAELVARARGTPSTG
jgi:serine/threonine-protein kinase